MHQLTIKPYFYTVVTAQLKHRLTLPVRPDVTTQIRSSVVKTADELRNTDKPCKRSSVLPLVKARAVEQNYCTGRGLSAKGGRNTIDLVHLKAAGQTLPLLVFPLEAAGKLSPFNNRLHIEICAAMSAPAVEAHFVIFEPAFKRRYQVDANIKPLKKICPILSFTQRYHLCNQRTRVISIIQSPTALPVSHKCIRTFNRRLCLVNQLALNRTRRKT